MMSVSALSVVLDWLFREYYLDDDPHVVISTRILGDSGTSRLQGHRDTQCKSELSI